MKITYLRWESITVAFDEPVYFSTFRKLVSERRYTEAAIRFTRDQHLWINDQQKNALLLGATQIQELTPWSLHATGFCWIATVLPKRGKIPEDKRVGATIICSL